MTAALSWLNDLMQWLGRWVPRPLLIRATHAGVRFGLRGAVVVLAPGLHWYWPIAQEIELVSRCRRTLMTSSQLNGREVVSLVVTYQVTDPKKLLLGLTDLHANLDQRAVSLLSNVWTQDAASTQLVAQLHESMASEFALYGVDVLEVGIAQRGRVIPIKQLGDYTWHEEKKL